MRVIAFFGFLFVLALLAAGVMLLGSWILGIGLGWLLGVETIPGMALALGALGVVAVIVYGVSSHPVLPQFGPIRHSPDGNEPDEDDEAGDDADGNDEYGDDDTPDDDDKNQEDAEYRPVDRNRQGGWMTPCPCGSGRPFAHCCGRRAFRKRAR